MLTRLPLLTDVHFHARDFNQPDKGTFASETAAALASGFGTVFCMPNTDPPIITVDRLVFAIRLAERTAFCDVAFNFGTRGEDLVELERAYDYVRALKVYLNPTTGDLEITDPDKVREVFAAWPGRKPIMVHAEEADKVKFVIGLAFKYHRQVHICHVSTAEQVSVIRAAKNLGVAVSAEVCPHHLVFTEAYLPKLGAYGLMKPPLATKADREAVWEGLEDGTIEIIATDHAPHTRAEKASEKPPFGVIGEQAFSLLWDIVHWDRPVDFLIEKMVLNPMRIFGTTADPNSYMLVDLAAESVFEESMVRSKAGFSPFVGSKLQGKIHSVTLHGKEVVRDGQVLSKPNGQVLGRGDTIRWH